MGEGTVVGAALVTEGVAVGTAVIPVGSGEGLPVDEGMGVTVSVGVRVNTGSGVWVSAGRGGLTVTLSVGTVQPANKTYPMSKKIR